MVDNFTYDFLLQVCEGVQGKQVKAKEKSIINTVKNVMWKELCILIWDFTYARAVAYAAMICLIGYGDQQSCTKRGNVFIKEMCIFNRKLESSYVENLLRSLTV